MMLLRGLKALIFCWIILVLAEGTVSTAWGQESEPPAGKAEENKEKKKDLPLEATRKLEFSTNEATWLSLDVSPDGTTLVMALLGDLYTLPIDGGQAGRITEGLGFDTQPKFSPDGEWIAFISDRSGSENVWIAKADGSEPKQLSRDSGKEQFASPTWTPDGDYVVASRTFWGLNTFELWMYHIQGGRGLRVTEAKPSANTPRNQRHNALGANFSPDGKYVYYATKRGGFSYNAMFPQWQIARRDMETGREDTMTRAGGSAMRPVLSPDGETMVFATRFETETGLRVRNLTTGTERWLIYPVQRDEQESVYSRDLYPNYCFTPDGTEVVTTFDGKIHRVDVESGRARPIPFTVDVSLDLGPRLHFPRPVEQGPVTARLIHDPVLSPDGGQVAFSALTHLYVQSVDADEPRRLGGEGDTGFHPSWSPDGRWVAYVTWQDGQGHLWKRPSDGSGAPLRLSQVAGFYSDPVWSPDGSKIVLLRSSAQDRMESGSGPAAELVWIAAEGGETNLIAPSRGLGKPHFNAAGDRVFLYASSSFGGGPGQGLVSMRLDGTDRRTHLRVTGTGFYSAEGPVGAGDMRMSPDGKWALAHSQNQLYLVTVPPTGGQVPTVNVNGGPVPLTKITDVGADYFGWADDGKTITWAIGSTFYRRPLDSVDIRPEEEGSEEQEESEEAEEETELLEDHEAVQALKVTIEVPRETPEGTVVLRRATVITMNGDEVIRDADIVVEGNRIQAVGRRGRVDLPRGARRIDLKDHYIVPGFIDTHAHWSEIRRGILDTQNFSFLANLAYGVTAGLDVQTGTNDMLAYLDLVDAGVIDGPRAFSTGPGIFSNNAFKSAEQAEAVMKRYRDHYRTRNLKSYLVGNRKQRQYVVMAAKELEMMPTTEGGLDLKLDLTHAVDGFAGNEHSLPVVPLFEDVVRLFAESGTAYTPTLLVLYGGPWAENYYYQTTEVHDNPKLNRFMPHQIIDARTKRRPAWFREDEHSFPRTAAQAAKIMRAGGLVGIGSHGQLQGLGYHWELWSLASGGLSPLEALRAATLDGAKIIGVSQDLGSIEPGKLADLIVLDRDPREDIRNTNSIRYVMKNGELFEGDTLNQVWPVERERQPLWWWDDAPRDRRQSQEEEE